MSKELLITVLILRSTVCAGKDLIANKTYELKEEEANLLIRLGKARELEDEVDVDINEDTTKAIEDMNKDELLEYAEELGIDIPAKATKPEIIDLINADQE